MKLLGNRRLWVVVAAGMGLALFLGVTVQNKLGFPLDDAWIHQTYARNLARNGRLEFTPGVSSAGSTAPLWTLLLALGYLLGVPYLLWAYSLGGACLVWLGWSGMRLWRALWPDWAEKDWLAGVVLVLTWPLLWAAVSGMETLFFAALGLQLSVWYAELVTKNVVTGRVLARLGFFAGLLILIRPDGLGLLLLILAGILLLPASFSDRLRRGGVLLGTAVLPLVPYFLFNFYTSGTIWPNTLYAKQVEYAAVLAQPFVTRLSQLLFLSLGGPASGWRGVSSPHLLLLPGLIIAVWHAVKADWAQRRLFYLLPLCWAGGHVLLYAWRLPVTFQHGRYLIPIMPIWVLYGLFGWVLVLLYSSSEYDRTLWLGKQVARLSFTIILLYFLLQGAFAFAVDVAIVEGEMVAVAGWLADNTPPDALIASHDIGAIGYFAERPLLDLAGLISPEVIPLLDNEDALAEYILASDAQYLVTAPGWPYTQIAEQPSTLLRFATNFALTNEQGLNNMAVYELAVP
ncbi:MAG: hypothetical protein H6654_19510 [Ardenticatenaceae bacterium]|nr:hypothetical protein [Anaerolineales bacterium]MCB8938220.1 hypothetical protein [Ardenticatenaceae bacterium]MCB8975756.1 hypothetical protein [Ardenticatenaceae bacterium]